MTQQLLFQFNLAWMRESFDHELFADFRAMLPAVHAHAESYDGYVGRYQGELSKQGYIMPYANHPLMMGNLSWWTNHQDLVDYTFTGPHMEMMREKRKWFYPPKIKPYTVLYYAPTDRVNDLDVAKMRWARLLYNGSTKDHFGFSDTQFYQQ